MFDYSPELEKLVIHMTAEEEKEIKESYVKKTDEWWEYLMNETIAEGPLLEVVEYLWKKPHLWEIDSNYLFGDCEIAFSGSALFPETLEDIALVNKKLGPVLSMQEGDDGNVIVFTRPKIFKGNDGKEKEFYFYVLKSEELKDKLIAQADRLVNKGRISEYHINVPDESLGNHWLWVVPKAVDT